MVKKKFLIKIRVKKTGQLLGSGTYQFEFADDTKMDVWVSKALMDYERNLKEDLIESVITEV